MYSEIITREIPKKYRRVGESKQIEWAECFFGRKMMPNGYEVTICGIEWNKQLFLGGSARAPHDLARNHAKGDGLAMGRARSQAFLCAYGGPPLVGTLVYDVDDEFPYGILPMTNETSKELIKHWFEIVARNAEERALRSEIHRIIARHGHRYHLTYNLFDPNDVEF